MPRGSKHRGGIMFKHFKHGWLVLALMLSGCTVKAVGDPNRPITINAHITIDVKGLKETASGIEDYVSGGKSSTPAENNGGKK